MKTKIKNIINAARGLAMHLKFIWCKWKAARIIARVKRQYPHSEGVMAANAWPATSNSTVGFIQTGSNIIGTDGLLQSPKPSIGFYVITDFEEESDIETEYLTNGTGIKANRISFIHGAIWNITVRDDYSMTPPRQNSSVNITDAACVIPGNTDPTAVYTANVRKASYKTAPKQAGERILTVENLILIDEQTPVGGLIS
jgi:hypothetical protein